MVKQVANPVEKAKVWASPNMAEEKAKKETRDKTRKAIGRRRTKVPERGPEEPQRTEH